MWKVGNGIHICLSAEKWIPNFLSNKAQFQSHLDIYNGGRVFYLVDYSTRSWKQSTIKNTFTEHQVNVILVILLRSFNDQDRIVWYPTNDG